MCWNTLQTRDLHRYLAFFSWYQYCLMFSSSLVLHPPPRFRFRNPLSLRRQSITCSLHPTRLLHGTCFRAFNAAVSTCQNTDFHLYEPFKRDWKVIWLECQAIGELKHIRLRPKTTMLLWGLESLQAELNGIRLRAELSQTGNKSVNYY